MKSLKKFIRHPTRRKKLLLITSGLLILLGWAAAWVWNAPLVFDVLMITATLFAGYEIIQKAWRGLRNRHTNISFC